MTTTFPSVKLIKVKYKPVSKPATKQKKMDSSTVAEMRSGSMVYLLYVA